MWGIYIKRFITLALAFFILTLGSSTVTAAEISVHPGESIQAAVNTANQGDEIVLSPGNYTENIAITKGNLVIRSESGNPEDTIITSSSNTSDIIQVQAQNVKIMGLSIIETGLGKSGINILNSNNCTINNNRFIRDTLAVSLHAATHNTISNNIMSEGGRGINLETSSDYNTIMGNDISSLKYGIYLTNSEGNIISGNQIKSNSNDGVILEYSNNNNLESNAVNSNKEYGFYLTNSGNNTLNNNTASGNIRGFNVVTSNQNTLSKNTVEDNGEYNILLSFSNGNSLSGNKASNSTRGIMLSTSEGNTVSGNTMASNTVSGIYICSTSNNNIVFNNYFNNIYNADIKSGCLGNEFNTTKTLGTNIVGGPYIGGNYWANPGGTAFSQKAVDKDGDGISEVVYKFSGNTTTDFLPLVEVNNLNPSASPVNENNTILANASNTNMPA